MKKGMKAKIIATFVCAFALCAALVGCSSGDSGDGSAAFQGDWVLSGGTSDGQELTQESIDAMQQMGLNVYVQFNEDGTFVMSLFGTDMQGTWTAKSATTADITLEGDTEEVKIVDGELTIEAEGNALRFKKGEAPTQAPATPSGPEVAGDDAADQQEADAEEATQRDAEQSATPEA